MAFQLFLLLEAFLMLLPSSFRKVFFSLLASLAYHISSRYRKIADNNLDFVFDNKMDKKTKDEIIRYSFKNLLFNFI